MSSKENENVIVNVSDLAARVFALGAEIREDVVNDFGSGSLFVLDFDSLFLSVVSKSSASLVESEILYRMERELSMYLDRRGRIEIVAFQNYELPVYKKHSSLQKLRDVALRHLIENIKPKTKSIVRIITTLSSPYEKDYYDEYLASAGPSFVVLHSGTSDWNLFSEQDRDMLRVHWLRVVSVEMRVVFGCDHVTAESNKLKAFGLDSNLASRIVRVFESLLQDTVKKSTKDSTSSTPEAATTATTTTTTSSLSSSNVTTPLLDIDSRIENIENSDNTNTSEMWKWHAELPLSFPGSQEKKWERSLTKTKKIQKADANAKAMLLTIAKEEYRRQSRGKGPPFDEREHGRVSGQKLHHAVQSNRIDLKEQGLRRTFVKLISKRFQENRDKFYSASEFFDVVRSHREKQEEEEEKRFQQSIAKIIVRSAQSLKGSMLEHSSAVLVQRKIETIRGKALLARERNQKKPRRQHLKKLQRLVKESLNSCCENLNSQDAMFGGSDVKRDVVMKVKYDEDLTFDPCLEFRVRSTFSGLYREEAEPKLLEAMKECLTRSAEILVEASAKEKKEKKKKKKTLPYGPKKLLEVLHPSNVELHVTGWGETKEAKDQWSSMVSTGLLRELRLDQMRQFVKTHWKHAPRTCANALIATLRTLISSSDTSLRIVLWELLLDLANPRVDNLGKVFLNHDPSILDGKGGTRPLRKELMMDSDVVVMLHAFEHLNLPEGARDLITRLKSLGVDLPSLKKSSFKAQQGSYVRWQLENAGHLFPRICGRLDSRIETFRPDPWQRNLLDIVDQRESVVVCAPTSSGKTFISFYAMKKILQESWEGVVVYVAPNKSLNHQSVASIYGQFSSRITSYTQKAEGRSAQSQKTLYGVFTKESHVNVKSCQILVTVPECLELLLLSAENVDWVRRIRYVVFDEVHCLEMKDIGLAWERCLQVIQCPFIALSATLGVPKVFQDWLQRSAKISDAPQVHLIEHDVRYNDLRKHLFCCSDETSSYLPHKNAVLVRVKSSKEEFENDLEALDKTVRELLRNHGVIVSVYRADTFDSKRYPDLTLWVLFEDESAATSARQRNSEVVNHLTYEFDSKIPLLPLLSMQPNSPLCKGWSTNHHRRMHPLLAVTTLTSSGEIRMSTSVPSSLALEPSDALALYDAMKTVSTISNDLSPDVWWSANGNRKRTPLHREDVLEWSKTLVKTLNEWYDSTPDKAHQVVTILDDGLQRVYQKCDNKPSSSNLLLRLAVDLNARKQTPTIVFNFDQHKCTSLAITLLEQLESIENRLLDSDPSFVRARRVAREAVASMGNTWTCSSCSEINPRNSRRCSRCHEGRGSNVSAVSAEDVDEQFETRPYDKRCSFAIGMSESQLESEYIAPLYRLFEEGENAPLLRALRRGVGIHHAAMRTAYLRTVEILFRLKVVKIVFATGTLAMGIHMPTRSVIFAGDSPMLSPLMFRQMQGRAGRRGFDKIGYVSFLDVPIQKIKRLLVSPLPRISGTYPMSGSLAARMLVMHLQSQNLDIESPNKKAPMLGFEDPKNRITTRPRELYVLQTLKALTEVPLYPHANPEHVKLHFKLLLGWLNSMGMCNQKGHAMRALSVPLHMYAQQPGSWALFVLLRRDLICEMVEEWRDVRAENRKALKNRGGTKMKSHEIEIEEKSLSQVKSRVVLLLCHMFGVIPVHPCSNDVLPCLEPLDKQVESVLRNHNEAVQGVFREFCTQAKRTEKTYEMPLSHVKFEGEKKEEKETSPFVMSSSSSFDLRACRHDVYIDESMVPVLELQGKRKSSWLIDLLEHRNLERIHREHNISPERIWTNASIFMNAVRSACQALKTYIHMFEWDDDVVNEEKEQKKKSNNNNNIEEEKKDEEGDEEEEDMDKDGSSSDDDWDAEGVADNWENAFESDSGSDKDDDDDVYEDEDDSFSADTKKTKKKKRASSMSSKGLVVERLELVHEVMEMVLNDVSECVNEAFDSFSYTNETAHADWIERVLKKE